LKRKKERGTTKGKVLARWMIVSGMQSGGKKKKKKVAEWFWHWKGKRSVRMTGREEERKMKTLKESNRRRHGRHRGRWDSLSTSFLRKERVR